MRTAGLAIWLALLGLALACMALAKQEHTGPNDGLPLVHADYQRCVTVTLPPIERPRRPDARRQPSELT